MRDLAELVKGAWKIRLYPAGCHLSELRMKATTKTPGGAAKQTSYADVAACQRALAERVAALVAEGWTDTGVGLPRPRAKPASPAPARARSKKVQPDLAALDAKLGALAEETIAALARAKSAAADEVVWRAAIAEYGKLRVAAGGDPTESLVHFFAVDGVGLEAAHPVVVTRAEGSAARKARWLALLEAAR